MADNRVQIRVGADLADVREAVGTWLPDQFASSGEAAAAGLEPVNRQLLGQRESVRLLTEEMGIRLPRAVTGAIAEMVPAIGSLSGVLLAAFAVKEIPHILSGISAAAQEWAGFGKAEQEAMQKAIRDTQALQVKVHDVEKELELFGKTQAQQLALQAQWAGVDADRALKGLLSAEAKVKAIQDHIAEEKKLSDVMSTQRVIILDLEENLKNAQASAAKARQEWKLADEQAFLAQKKAAAAAVEAQEKITKAVGGGSGPDYFSRVFGSGQQLGTYAVAIDGVTKAVDVDVKSVNLWINDLGRVQTVFSEINRELVSAEPSLRKASIGFKVYAEAVHLTAEAMGQLAKFEKDEKEAKAEAAEATLQGMIAEIGTFVGAIAGRKAQAEVEGAFYLAEGGFDLARGIYPPNPGLIARGLAVVYCESGSAEGI